MTDINNTTDTTGGTLLDPALCPVVLGYAFRTGTPVAGDKLHRGRGDADQHGVLLRCDRALRIVTPQAIVPATGGPASTYTHLLLGALAGLGVHSAHLCRRCFGRDLIITYGTARAYGWEKKLVAALSWEHELAQHRRTVTVSADAAALIAYEVAFTQDRAAARWCPTGERSDARHTVELSGHAQAVIAGLLAAPDLGDSPAAEDPARVWQQGITASESTWEELHTAFPLTLWQQRDLRTASLDEVWDEARRVFPLETFRAWAEKSREFTCTYPDPGLGMDVGTELINHYYDPEAGL